MGKTFWVSLFSALFIIETVNSLHYSTQKNPKQTATVSANAKHNGGEAFVAARSKDNELHLKPEIMKIASKTAVVISVNLPPVVFGFFTRRSKY